MQQLNETIRAYKPTKMTFLFDETIAAYRQKLLTTPLHQQVLKLTHSVSADVKSWLTNVIYYRPVHISQNGTGTQIKIMCKILPKRFATKV